MSSPIQGISQNLIDRASTPGASSQSDTATNSSFMRTLRGAMDQVGQLQSEADSKVAQMLTGNGQDVHSAMIAVEKANLAFEMMVQVRNKIVQAYQQVSGMPF